jgi:hypothetical protein
MPYYHENHSGGKKHFQQQDLSLILDEIIYFLRHRPKPVFVTFWIKVNYLQCLEVPYVPMCFNLSNSNRSLTFR